MRIRGPKYGEPFERISKGGHIFKWNPAGDNGTGFWDFVKTGDDKSGDAKPADTTSKPSSDTNISSIPEDSPKKKARKNVSFDENTKNATTVSVNKSCLLANLTHLDDSQQSFIAQFVPKE